MISFLNILNLIGVLLSLSFQILLGRFFGAASETDLYFISWGIIQFINLNAVGFLTDLYIPIYSDIRSRDPEESKRFSCAIFFFGLFSSIIISILIFFCAPLLIRIFASGLPKEQIFLCSKFVRILLVYLIFAFITSILNVTLNANLYLSITYWTALINPIFNIGALLFLSKNYGLDAIIYSIVLAAIINFAILFPYLIKKIGWISSNPFNQSSVLHLIKKNMPLRLGVWIYLLQKPVTTNVLSYLPTGYITLFNYANNLLGMLFKITNSAILQVLYVKASNLLSKTKINELRNVLFSTLKNNVILLITAFIPLAVFFKKLCIFLFKNKIPLDQIHLMYILFVALMPLYLVCSLESPFTFIIIAMKKSYKILQIAIINILIYCLILLSGMKYFGIFVIPLAMLLAELSNFFLYLKCTQKYLNIIDYEIKKCIIHFSFYGCLMVTINFIFQNHFYHNLLCNIIFFSAWLLFAKTEMINAFLMITRKDEIR